jgi:hypothetical protein
MRRAVLVVVTAALGSGCWNFSGLLDECRDGGAQCARASGGGTGGGGTGGGAGGGAGGGDGGGGGGGTSSDGGPLCPLDAGATNTLPDGAVAFCFNGFQWENPLPQGNWLLAVGGAADDDVWAGGTASMLMHWDGLQWTSHQGEVPVTWRHDSAITGLRGLPGNGGWLVGRGLPPHSLDGGAWEATSESAGDWFFSALGASPDGRRVVAVTAAGEVGQPPFGMLLQPGWPQANDVRGVAVADDGGCWFSGTYNDGGVDFRFLRSCDGLVQLSLDAGSSMGPVWLEPQGAYGYAMDNTIYTLWPDGGTSTGSTTTCESATLFAATRTPTQDYAVGSNRCIADLDTGAVQSVQGAPTTTQHTLFAVAAFEDGGAWSVGSGGALAQRRGTQWTWRLGGVSETFFGLLVDAQGVVAVGESGIAWVRGGVAQRPGSAALRDVARSADGGLLLASDDGKLQLGAFTIQSLQTELHDLYTSSPGVGWAVGTNNVIATNTNTPDGGWITVTNPAALTWWKVDGRDGFVVVVGEPRSVVRYVDGGAINEVAGLTSDAYGVWVEDGVNRRAWIVGGDLGMWRLDGETLSPQQPPFGLDYGSFFDVWGFDANDVWAVGQNGGAVHFDGQEWTRVETGTRNQLERVRGRRLPDGRRELFIVGEAGTVLRYLY